MRCALQTRFFCQRHAPEVATLDSDQPFSWTVERFRQALREVTCLPYIVEDAKARIAGAIIGQMRAKHLQILRVIGDDIARAKLHAKVKRKLTKGTYKQIVYDVPETWVMEQVFLRDCEGFGCTEIIYGSQGDEPLYRMMYPFPLD